MCFASNLNAPSSLAYHAFIHVNESNVFAGKPGHIAVELRADRIGVYNANNSGEEILAESDYYSSLTNHWIRDYNPIIQGLVAWLIPLPSIIAEEHSSEDYSRRIHLKLSKERYEGMLLRMRQLKERTGTGQVAYALFPSFCPYGALVKGASKQSVAGALSSCPFSGLDLANERLPGTSASIWESTMKSHEDLELHTCVTAVDSILSAGGVEGLDSRWQLTPSQLGDGLERRYSGVNWLEKE